MAVSELKRYISSYFGVLEEAELNTFVSLFKPFKYKKNEYLLEAGKRSDKLCFVQSGLFRMYTLAEGKEITQWISKKGYFAVDLSSFIFDHASRFTIQALEVSEVFYISKTDYKNISHQVPRWLELEKLFLVRCFTMLEDRIVSHLSMSAEERYEMYFEQNKELFNQVPLQYIASLLGMTPETFSRIRKKHIV
jgi:CRP/FNR family transcriptional regulator, anaerobic regulatory protein